MYNPSNIDQVVKILYYRIAECVIKVVVDYQFEEDTLLPSFCGFKEDFVDDSEIISEVNIVCGALPLSSEPTKLLSDISIVWGSRFRFYEQSGMYMTFVDTDHSDADCCMLSSKDFTKSTIYYKNGLIDLKEIVNWFLMVTFAQSCLKRDVILIHASVVEKDGYGYAFLGKSGTGKSTHSSLWIEHVSGVQLLNDDNPAIRVKEEGVTVYGTPWSGKTPCYRNFAVDLAAFVRLRQAPHNAFQWTTGAGALISLLPSCSGIRWNQSLYAKMMDSLESVIAKTAIGALECLPNQEAVELCYYKISKR